MKKPIRETQPISNVQWIHRDILHANDYNPNKVAPPEIRLLKVSILEDGWTQPIVINPDMEIVDGFHRWTVSGHKELMEVYEGYIPTVMTSPKDKASQKMATIRHNRARGTHFVLSMAEIVVSLIDDGISVKEIMARLQMDREEVVRLSLRAGIPMTEKVEQNEFSQAWEPDAHKD